MTGKTGSRGRPAADDDETRDREFRKAAFGRKLRALREAAGVSTRMVAEMAGLGSARGLQQYEGRCYPPGSVVRRIAVHYGVTPRAMGEMVLMHSDPDLYEIVTGKPGVRRPPGETRDDG